MHLFAEMIPEALGLINDTVEVRNIPVIQSRSRQNAARRLQTDPSTNKYNDDCLAIPVKPNPLLAYKNINISRRQRQKHMFMMRSDPQESDEHQFQKFLW